MPELPEVETVARTLTPYVVGNVFAWVKPLLASTVHPMSLPLENLAGMRVQAGRRRAKLLLLDLEPTSETAARQDAPPTALVFHLRMTGRLFTPAANAAEGKHTRCVFGLRKPDGSETRLFFDDTRTFGKIFAATPALLEQWTFWRNLGPEPLEIDASALASRLTGTRAIKTALLDQKVIAGIGNIYADEALFRARISPLRKAGDINGKECAKLLDAIKKTLLQSIAQCGSSIRDYRDADGNVGAFQNSFAVYGRGGEKCRKCGRELQKIRLGGRATVFCGHCQK